MPTPLQHIEARPLAAAIGAEISGAAKDLISRLGHALKATGNPGNAMALNAILFIVAVLAHHESDIIAMSSKTATLLAENPNIIRLMRRTHMTNGAAHSRCPSGLGRWVG